MAIPCYLAMTAAEMEKEIPLPGRLSWMACHFSLYTKGLSNLPKSLPAGALLMLDDVNPVSGHDPAMVAQQLEEVLETFSCVGVLLDFQRPDRAETAVMAAELCSRLPGRVVVSAAYAQGLSCPVCLPPVPCNVALQAYLEPWKTREILLEWALTKENWDVTEAGTQRREVLGERMPEGGFWEKTLHCHYRVTRKAECLQFMLWRTLEDMKALGEEAESCGVKAMVGLWQELGTAF